MSDDCEICRKKVNDGEEALFCEDCECWSHRNCLNISKTTFKKLERSKDPWFCQKCLVKKSKTTTQTKDNYTMADIMAKLTEMDEKYSKLMNRYEEQLRVNSDLKKELQCIKKQLNNQEQSSLNNNIIIQGIPYRKTEDIKELVSRVADSLGVQNNAQIAYRLGNVKEESKVLPIRVTFKNEADKKNWMVAKRQKKITTADLKVDDDHKQIYINHDLTKHNLELYKAARQHQKENNIKYLWINKGKILLRKNDTSRTELVEDENDLKN